jgi:desulfoferrodoxin (superoxide reductase-like protein)
LTTLTHQHKTFWLIYAYLGLFGVSKVLNKTTKMFRAFLGRTGPIIAGTSAALVLNSGSHSLSPLEEARNNATKEVVGFSSHKSVQELRAAGVKRRAASDCSFCKFMTDGPCGDVYGEWDDCVHESKEAKSDFVKVCSPFTQALMDCISQHPDYYKELSQMKKEEPASDEWDWKSEVSNFMVSLPILSAKSPGAWAGKEGKHVPSVSVNNKMGTVVVNHGMDAEHFIEYIWVRDDDTGKIIAIIKLTPESKPELLFNIPEGVSKFTAFEKCNL